MRFPKFIPLIVWIIDWTFITLSLHSSWHWRNSAPPNIKICYLPHDVQLPVVIVKWIFRINLGHLATVILELWLWSCVCWLFGQNILPYLKWYLWSALSKSIHHMIIACNFINLPTMLLRIKKRECNSGWLGIYRMDSRRPSHEDKRFDCFWTLCFSFEQFDHLVIFLGCLTG